MQSKQALQRMAMRMDTDMAMDMVMDTGMDYGYGKGYGYYEDEEDLNQIFIRKVVWSQQ